MLYSRYNSSAGHRDLHSFPTRRSSDLTTANADSIIARKSHSETKPNHARRERSASQPAPNKRKSAVVAFPGDDRSEEHTSELQSLTNLVCRLLLEKKNKDRDNHDNAAG